MENITKWRSPSFILQKLIQLWAIDQEKALLDISSPEKLQEEAMRIIFGTSKKKNNEYTFTYNGITKVFTYQQLQESIHACHLAFAYNKASWGMLRSNIVLSDYPDVIFISDNDTVQVEICEPDSYWSKNEKHVMVDAAQEVEKIWKLKGLKDYWQNTYLLVVYNNNIKFDYHLYATEVSQRKWSYKRIILSLYRKKDKKFCYYIINPNDISGWKAIDISLVPDKEYLY